MRWKLIVVLQSIFIIHYFDLNPIWPGLLERIQEPGGQGGGSDLPYSKGFMKFGCRESSKEMFDFWNFCSSERHLARYFWRTLFFLAKWDKVTRKKTIFYGQADRKGGGSSAPSALTINKCENFDPWNMEWNMTLRYSKHILSHCEGSQKRLLRLCSTAIWPFVDRAAPAVRRSCELL